MPSAVQVGLVGVGGGELKNKAKLSQVELELGLSLAKIHLKYVDDLTVAECIILKDNVFPVPDRPRPDSYHARTGHALIPEKSEVYKEIKNIEQYAASNDMKLNAKRPNLYCSTNARAQILCQTWREMILNW